MGGSQAEEQPEKVVFPLSLHCGSQGNKKDNQGGTTGVYGPKANYEKHTLSSLLQCQGRGGSFLMPRSFHNSTR